MQSLASVIEPGSRHSRVFLSAPIVRGPVAGLFDGSTPMEGWLPIPEHLSKLPGIFLGVGYGHGEPNFAQVDGLDNKGYALIWYPVFEDIKSEWLCPYGTHDVMLVSTKSRGDFLRHAWMDDGGVMMRTVFEPPTVKRSHYQDELIKPQDLAFWPPGLLTAHYVDQGTVESQLSELDRKIIESLGFK